MSVLLSETEQNSKLKAFWRMPSLVVARFTLLSYIRSGWILFDLVFVWLLYAFFFLEFGGNVTYFFGTAGQGLGMETILGTIIMLQRAMSARVYLPLSRLTSRASYIRGLILATCVLRIPLFLLLLLLASLYHHFSPPACTGIGGCIAGANAANLSIGAIGLLLNCFAIATLVVAISAPIATRIVRIVALAWFAAILYSNTSPDPIAQFLAFTRIPLIPMGICYNLNLPSNGGWIGLLSVVVVIGYVVGLTWLAQYWMARRDLMLG